MLHFITFWLFRAVVPNDTSDPAHPPQVFSKVWLDRVVETKVLRNSLFYPGWAFEYLQVVLVFTLVEIGRNKFIEFCNYQGFICRNRRVQNATKCSFS